MSEVFGIDSRILFSLVVGMVGVQRLVELRISKRNTRTRLQLGGKEFGRSHYPWMVAVHTGVIIGSLLEVWLLPRPWLPLLALLSCSGLVAGGLLRFWVMRTLGSRWTSRVIVVADDPVETAGPYRWMRHPNYLAVVVEMIALPMFHTAWMTAVIGGAANAAILRIRMRVEERALIDESDYGERFERHGRLLPRVG